MPREIRFPVAWSRLGHPESGHRQKPLSLNMLEAATKTAAALQISGSSFTVFTPSVVYQEGHPADVPETLASLTAVRKEIGWAPRIFFPKTPDSDAKKV